MRKITRRSFLAAAAVCGAAVALTACGGSSASSTAASSVASSAAAGSAAASGDSYTIGICQLVQHAALDAATQGFEDASISTSGFTMNPLYDLSGSEQRVTGYEMRTQITVSDVEMDRVGELLSGGVAQGANEIQQVQYYSSDYDEAYNQALEKAITSAKTKAETMAHADNYQVIDLLHVTENGNNQYGRYVDAGIYQNSAMKESASAAVDMAVMPGQMEVTADVTVEFLILPQ